MLCKMCCTDGEATGMEADVAVLAAIKGEVADRTVVALEGEEQDGEALGQ